MRILLTGSSGFQGKHLAKRLQNDGHTVFMYDIHHGYDLMDSSMVNIHVQDVDLVFHMGAKTYVGESVLRPGDYLKVNVMGTYNILEAVKAHKAKLVYVSSCEVYGYQNQILTETSRMSPNTPYAASKAAADLLCQTYRKTYGIDVCILRPSNVYGDGQKNNVIPLFIENAIHHRPMLIHGNGLQTREFTHVSDIVEAYCMIIEQDSYQFNQEYNIGSGEKVSINEIARLIKKYVPHAKMQYVGERPADVKDFTFTSNKIRQLGWEAIISFEQGLRALINEADLDALLEADTEAIRDAP